MRAWCAAPYASHGASPERVGNTHVRAIHCELYHFVRCRRCVWCGAGLCSIAFIQKRKRFLFELKFCVEWQADAVRAPPRGVHAAPPLNRDARASTSTITLTIFTLPARSLALVLSCPNRRMQATPVPTGEAW